MSNKVWNGTVGTYETAARWTPNGVPVPGDTVSISAGTVTGTSDLLVGLAISLSGTGTLKFIDSTLAASSSLSTSGSTSVLGVVGTFTNNGTITFGGTTTANSRLTLQANASGSPGTLVNKGTINIQSSPVISATTTTASVALQNDGVINVINALAGGQAPIVAADLVGTGTVNLLNEARIDLMNALGSGQTVVFVPGAKNAIFQDDSPGTIAGSFQGFAATDIVTLSNLAPTTLSYASTSATSGTLTLKTSTGTTAATLKMKGVYTASDFGLAYYNFGGGRTNTTITTTATIPTLYYTDTTTNVSGNALATLYDGPVSYLQWQYLWSGSDGVAMSITAPNVFLHGGSGNDALQVTSGQNVLDGGGGSNFLVGGTGAGSADTFYVDGTSGESTWSTIVNFHAGDSATIFGFTPGTSTLPWTASDGAAGYTGATIHSELGGAGTGANGSITFAGIDLNTANAYFDITSGTIGTIGYLLIQYNATPHVSYTDTTTGVSSTALATVYSGPVAGLQWEYLWAGADSVAISAAMPNVFLHGGSGNDALAVTGGVNVLDGGGGSNFLVGGTGPGSQDTFFVDGTSGQSTWSSIVNFHLGDSATIFGFNPGVSTLPWTASDGAAGYTGATIHSELGGPGTGANGSITFAGIDLATVESHFTITSGTIGGTIGYLLVQYDH